MPRNQPPHYGESSSRLLELKPAIDRIIADCRSDGGELRSGLEILKDYQMDIMEELDRYQGRANVNYTSDYPSYAPSYEPERDHSREIVNTKAARNKQNYIPTNLQRQNNGRKLRTIVDQEDDYYDDQYNRQQYPAGGRPYQHYYQDYDEDEVRGYDRNPNYYQRRQNQYYDSGSDSQSKDDLIRNLIAQNNQLKALVHQLERKLQSSQIKLRRAQQRSGFSNIKKQLQTLKRQNEQLRQNTIRLLNQKSYESSGGSDDSHWRRQFQRLQRQIQNQNRLKQEFLQQLTQFKGKYKQCENQRRALQDELNRTKGTDYRAPSNEGLNRGNRVEQRIQYEEGGINRYKNLLQDMKSKY